MVAGRNKISIARLQSAEATMVQHLNIAIQAGFLLAIDSHSSYSVTTYGPACPTNVVFIYHTGRILTGHYQAMRFHGMGPIQEFKTFHTFFFDAFNTVKLEDVLTMMVNIKNIFLSNFKLFSYRNRRIKKILKKKMINQFSQHQKEDFCFRKTVQKKL